ncbi:MAG: hypothetical protein N3F07_00550 [Candidatus Micrarchaeota archaeon]|nr:hypothetical protein [Candidatus Micrarchaeota archaeon]
MKFSCSAPCKAILFGEHYVVYGAPALSIPIEPRNKVHFFRGEGSGLLLESSLGAARMSGRRFAGEPALKIYQKAALAIVGKGSLPDARARFQPAWSAKGVGISASLCAAFAAGILKLKGRKASPNRIFMAAQQGDLLAHGGRASGIDAKTVSFGKPLIFQRSFQPPKFSAKPMRLLLPRSSRLLLVDTWRGKRSRTEEMLLAFARQFGASGLPEEVGEEKRQEIVEEYLPVWKKARAGLQKADAREIGRLMSENQDLLRKRKVSSRGIDKAVESALSLGAYGAKLTGGGGEGGAVLVLCKRKDEKMVARGIFQQTGFPCRPIEVAERGAGLD